MNKCVLLTISAIAVLFSGIAVAAPNGAQPGSIASGSDIVVALPPDTLSQRGNETPPPCLRCCTYENRNYTEGAMVTMAGHLLQCARDERSLGTNNLIWREIR